MKSITQLLVTLTLLSNLHNGAIASPAWFGVSPDNSQALIMNVLGSARKEILINIYQFTNPLFRDEIIKRIRSGVTVKMLVEGQPYESDGRKAHGTMAPEMRDNLLAIKKAMDESKKPNHRIYILFAKQTKDRRFVYDHAKYMVVDQARVFVSSDNLTRTTAPDSGKTGSRGWHAFIEDKRLVKEITELFKFDSDPKNRDIVDLGRDPFPPAPGEVRERKPDADRVTEGFALGKGDVEVGAVITSPNSDTELVRFIRSAKSSVEIEYATLTSSWKTDGEFENNPITEALLEAAKKKITVRVLLNDDETFGPIPVKARTNLRTACFVQRIASGMKLPLTAKIINRKATDLAYVHNKGIIVDNSRVLVSSINGTKNSMLNNRELGVVLDSDDAADYFGAVFDFDWNQSQKPTFDTCQEFKKASAQ